LPRRPKLIVLNGPPGIGKSTLAGRYVDDHPLALLLDIDTIRSLLGRWIDDQPESGRLARVLAVQMARLHLTAGYDVVVPQLLTRPELLHQLEGVAADVPADLHEIALVDTKEQAIERFVARADAPVPAPRFDPSALVERNGGVETVAQQYDDLMAMLATRARVTVVETRSGQVDDAYAALLREVSG
jgi:predicted kinase